jgi:hypothetical protein
MLIGTIRNQVDQNWNIFRSGGVSNPISVVEQLPFCLTSAPMGQFRSI